MVTELKELVRMEKACLKQASLMLAQAFQDDPISDYAYTNPAEKEARMPYAYEFLLRYGIRFGQAHATSPKLEGIAVWLRSDKASMSFWRLMLSGALPPMMKMGREPGRRMQRFSKYIEARRKELVPFPHWYLMLLGVDSKFQGRGYASMLLRETLSRIDEEGLPSYLETETERNVAMYQHFGFEVIEEFIIPGTTVKLWLMLRGKEKK